MKASRRYTLDDFDNDLRHLLKRTGCAGERVCFIFDESNILDTAFLERMNALLASGEVPGLFEGDELVVLMTGVREAAGTHPLAWNAYTPSHTHKHAHARVHTHARAVGTSASAVSNCASRPSTRRDDSHML